MKHYWETHVIVTTQGKPGKTLAILLSETENDEGPTDTDCVHASSYFNLFVDYPALLAYPTRELSTIPQLPAKTPFEHMGCRFWILSRAADGDGA